MQLSLFPEEFRLSLKQYSGFMAGPLKIVQKLLTDRSCNPLLNSIRADQRQVSKKRARKRNLELSTNVNRHMKAELVLIFCTVRGFYPDIYGERGYEIMKESQSLRDVLAGYAVSKFPSRQTVFDQVKGLSLETLNLFNQLILSHAQAAGLDDFSALTMDSTAIEADSAYPVDSNVLKKLSANILKKLKALIAELPARNQRRYYLKNLENHIAKIALLDFETSSVKGKQGAKKKRKRLYRDLLISAQKIEIRLNKILLDLDNELIDYKGIRDFDTTCYDFYNKVTTTLERFGYQCEDRGFDEPKKVLSLADKSAVFIKKGGRETVFGYRPTFGQSAKGFITAVTIKEGNTSDAKAFRNVVLEHKKNTKIMPSFVNTDDGYASTANLDWSIDKNINFVSFGGSKGKKIIGKELYESEEFRMARHQRSAAEATISNLKNVRGLNRFTVCGISRVRKELTIQVIGYNLEKMVQLFKSETMACAA